MYNTNVFFLVSIGKRIDILLKHILKNEYLKQTAQIVLSENIIKSNINQSAPRIIITKN